MPDEGKLAIHWFRRDLRIEDNISLQSASKAGFAVVPVYILSDWKNHHPWTGPNRQQFLCESLAALSESLETISGKLIIRCGDAVAELEKLIRETKAVSLYYNSDPDPFGKSTEKKVRDLCREMGVECQGHHDHSLHDPDEVRTKTGQPYKVFTPYCKNWLLLDKAEPLAKPGPLHSPKNIPSLDLPEISHWGLKGPKADILNAADAPSRLSRAVKEKISRYADLRDFPAEEATSRISQDLRFGLVSIRTIFSKVSRARGSANASERESIDIFIKELAWREFYFAILHHFPDVLDEEFNPDWRGLPWDEAGEKFDSWKNGRTGFPIVDAGMRQLLATGFMHNRVRMITAMFLTKDLHVDWRLGESWFMQQLVDGEIASNNGGWQWSAGTGADAAPYFRIQNPWTQTARYDPKGIYIKRWIPELANVNPKLFLAPPKDGKRIADDYPLPIVDHHRERERTLEIFKRHRQKMR